MRLMEFSNPPYIISTSTAVGKNEYNGPLGEYFDFHDEDEKFGESTWEKAESRMQHIALNGALTKINAVPADIDAIFAGDLINQCTGSTFGMMSFNCPYFGLYGACSTFAEGIILASLALESGHLKTAAAISSSHFCSAERQFRFPLEYGGQRSPTAQWTATAAGAMLLSKVGSGARVTQAYPGKIIDKGINDVNNMGAAMAPAAIDTLNGYFNESKTTPQDFDMILTGDLGSEGKRILNDYMKINGYDVSAIYNDCGLLIYDTVAEDKHAGGSGCGCSASVIAGYVMKLLETKQIKNILYIATGALMSPGTLQQGCTIPGIAHLVRIEGK